MCIDWFKKAREITESHTGSGMKYRGGIVHLGQDEWPVEAGRECPRCSNYPIRDGEPCPVCGYSVSDYWREHGGES